MLTVFVCTIIFIYIAMIFFYFTILEVEDVVSVTENLLNPFNASKIPRAGPST